MNLGKSLSTFVLQFCLCERVEYFMCTEISPDLGFPFCHLCICITCSTIMLCIRHPNCIQRFDKHVCTFVQFCLQICFQASDGVISLKPLLQSLLHQIKKENFRGKGFILKQMSKHKRQSNYKLISKSTHFFPRDYTSMFLHSLKQFFLGTNINFITVISVTWPCTIPVKVQKKKEHPLLMNLQN